MPLVNFNKILKRAQKEGYAVGTFNIFNIEDITAVIRVAEEANAPVILQKRAIQL
jgi:tagatose 1,6-diphosphate aldolase GatY/KbaY